MIFYTFSPLCPIVKMSTSCRPIMDQGMAHIMSGSLPWCTICIYFIRRYRFELLPPFSLNLVSFCMKPAFIKSLIPRYTRTGNLKNTSDISDLCHTSQEPVFITKNGYGDMVIMSMETYENTVWKSSLYRGLEVSEEQIHSGRTKDARASLDELKDKYGL